MNNAERKTAPNASSHATDQLSSRAAQRAGKVKYALLGWLIGLPLPILVLLLFFRGCDF